MLSNLGVIVILQLWTTSLEFLLNKKYRMKTYLLPTMCACVRVYVCLSNSVMKKCIEFWLQTSPVKLGFNFCFNVSINISYDVYLKYKYVYGLFPPFHKAPANRFSSSPLKWVGTK